MTFSSFLWEVLPSTIVLCGVICVCAMGILGLGRQSVPVDCLLVHTVPTLPLKAPTCKPGTLVPCEAHPLRESLGEAYYCWGQPPKAQMLKIGGQHE